MRGYWFSKWFVALGLFLPIWGYFSLTSYSGSQSFFWNAANQQIAVSFLPEENFLVCTQNFLRRAVMTPFGFQVEPKPFSCMKPLLLNYINVLAVAFFLLFVGAYTILRPPYEFDPYAEQKRKAAKVAAETTDSPSPPQPQPNEKEWQG
jgi:hypothetical protein